MGYQFFVILFVVYIETIPQVTANDDTTESQVLGHVDVIKTDAPQSIHLLVNQSLARSFLQYIHRQCRFVGWIALAVEHGLEEYVVGALLRFFQLVDAATGAADVAAIASWRIHAAVVDMDAFQPVFLFQIEVVMHSDAPVVVFRQQRQQSFRVDWLGLRLIQVQAVHPRFKERGQYFVLFHEERGLSHNDELH